MEIEEEIYLPSNINQPQEHQALDYVLCSNKLDIIANDELVTLTVVEEFANYVQGSNSKLILNPFQKQLMKIYRSNWEFKSSSNKQRSERHGFSTDSIICRIEDK